MAVGMHFATRIACGAGFDVTTRSKAHAVPDRHRARAWWPVATPQPRFDAQNYRAHCTLVETTALCTGWRVRYRRRTRWSRPDENLVRMRHAAADGRLRDDAGAWRGRLGMKVTALMSFWGALVFGVVCLGVGLDGLWSLDALSDEALRADARGFAWFWLFLASIALLIAVLSGLMARGKLGGAE
jgi:hypothetical protein